MYFLFGFCFFRVFFSNFWWCFVFFAIFFYTYLVRVLYVFFVIICIFLYTNSVFLSRSNYPSQYFPSNWWNLIPDYKFFFFSQCDSFESSFCLIFFLSMKFPSSILWIAFENERVQKPYTSILIQLTIPFPFAYAKCIKRLFLTHSLSLSHSVNICVYTHSANVRPILNDIFHSCNIDKMKTGQITAMWPK